MRHNMRRNARIVGIERGAKLSGHTHTRNKLQTLLALTRWRQHVPFVIPLTLIGALMASRLNPHIELDWRLGTVTVANILAVSGAFIINDLVDSPDDRLDREKQSNNLISLGLIDPQTAQRAFYGVMAVSAGLFLISGQWAVVLGWGGILLGYMYSAPPFRLKSRPVYDILSHAIGAGGLQIMIGYFLYDNSPGIAWYVIVAMTLASVYGQFYNQLEDYEVDKQVGLNNTTLWIGKLPAKVAMYASMTVCGVLLFAALFAGVFPGWLGMVILLASVACALFVWDTDMRGRPETGLDAIQIPALLIFNLTMFLWLAWTLGWFAPGVPA